MGYCKPFALPSMNKLEIVNEALIMLASYCLMTFTGWLPDELLVYDCGWAMIGLILFMMALNLSLIIASTLRRVVWAVRMRRLRRKNLKLRNTN